MSQRPGQAGPHLKCSTCSSLADHEYGYQKGGADWQNTRLPPASSKLEVVRDFRPRSDRALQVRRCPECRTYYLYKSDYEFLVGGTEDEQFLDRLTNGEALAYLEDRTS